MKLEVREVIKYSQALKVVRTALNKYAIGELPQSREKLEVEASLSKLSELIGKLMGTELRIRG